MPKIVVAPLAQADIDEIWDYIERDSVANADHFIDGIQRRFRLLAANPGLGIAREDLRPGLRRLAYARYLVYYQSWRIADGPAGTSRLQGRRRDTRDVEPGIRERFLLETLPL
jgi:toxin ParE1/3/4